MKRYLIVYTYGDLNIFIRSDSEPFEYESVLLEYPAIKGDVFPTFPPVN